MTKNQTRLRYSGFILFTMQVVSLATGLIFTLLLTRTMTTDQYNVWTNIFDYTGYFMLFSGILPFWATRFVSRDKVGTVKTGASAQLAIGLASVIIYLPAIVLISRAIGTTAYLPIYLITGLYVLTFYIITIFESVLQAIKPQAVGYGILIEEIVKVGIALGIVGAFGAKEIFYAGILGLSVSCVVQMFYYVYLLAPYLKEKLHWGYLKEWLKGSPAIAYNAIGSQIMSFPLILLFLYGGDGARAYYQAAFTFTMVISFANSLAYALYPKLLANSCTNEHVGSSFQTVLMLAIPFSTIAMVMSTSFLTILKVSYIVAWPVVIALTADTLVLLVYSFYSSCLMGIESFDAEGKISIRKLVKSKIFKVFTVPYIQAFIAIPVTYFVLTRLPIANPVQAAVEVVTILVAVHLSTLIGLYAFMRRTIRIPVAWKIIAKYIFAALATGVFLYLVPTTSTLIFTIFKAIAGFALYIGLLLVIDKQARDLLALVILEIKGSFRMLIGKDNGDNDNSNSGQNSNVTTEN